MYINYFNVSNKYFSPFNLVERIRENESNQYRDLANSIFNNNELIHIYREGTESTMNKGKEVNKNFLTHLLSRRKYIGDGSDLSEDNKICTILFPYEYYSGEKEHEDKVYLSSKNFDNNTKFVRLIFTHNKDDENYYFAIVEFIGTTLSYPIGWYDGKFKIDSNAKKVLVRRLGKQGFNALLAYIDKYLILYHLYPNKDMESYIKINAYNSNMQTESLPDIIYYNLGKDNHMLTRVS